ncbi:MAG TPA: hypothetical protein ENH82_09030 [bacterium]|nr:hypothetical protein [bacterium]
MFKVDIFSGSTKYPGAWLASSLRASLCGSLSPGDFFWVGSLMYPTVKAYAAAQTANELALSILLYVLLLIILYLLCGCLDSHFLVFILQTLSYSVKHFNLLIPLKFPAFLGDLTINQKTTNSSLSY